MLGGATTLCRKISFVASAGLSTRAQSSHCQCRPFYASDASAYLITPAQSFQRQGLIVVQMDLSLLLNYWNIFLVDKTGWLSIKQIGYRQNRLVIDRTGWLSIEQIGYRQNRLVIDRTGWLLIKQIVFQQNKQIGYQQNRLAMAIDRTGCLSIRQIGY